MSYYDNNGQWPGAGPQNNWEHQTPSLRAGANGPTAQDEFAFSYQFDEVDRAYENLTKSGKTFGMPGRMSRAAGGAAASRPHLPEFGDAPRGHPSGNVQGFYANQRHQPSRGSNEAEQVMQAKRRMAAQRERELRNLHTEQQYQRTAVLADSPYAAKPMSEEETRDLIARQRSALYKEGPFAENGGYVDEAGAIRPGAPGHSGPASLRGASPLAYELGRNQPQGAADAGAPGSAPDSAAPTGLNQEGSRPNSTASPQPNPNGSKGAFDSSSSRGGSPNRDGSSKPNQPAATVAPIGTRPSGTPASNAGAGANANANTTAKRSTTPLASPATNWGRGGWPQSSGLGGQTSVWA